MMKVENVIIGAGPYGLSLAAHLGNAKVDHLLVGTPMHSWRQHMPVGMALKSERFASNLSDPARRYTLKNFCATRGATYAASGVPVSIAEFLDYADWFRQEAVPELWDTKVRSLRWLGDGFELAFDDKTILANRVIVATGHLAFRHFSDSIKDIAQRAPALISHAADHHVFERFAGQEVTIIGCGQSALETAALLHEQGANVRVIARAPAIDWNAEHETHRTLIKRLRSPEAGLGAGWAGLAYSELPHLFYWLPERTRRHIVKTANGPSGAWWLKNRVAGKISVLTSSEVITAVEKTSGVHLSVRSGDRLIEIATDHVIAGTGYKVDLTRLDFLDPALLAQIKTSAGPPVLNTAFECSVPNLHFIGIASALSFGPVMRFVYGSRHAANALTSHIRSPAPKKIPSGWFVGKSSPLVKRFGL